ncbi:hypothetical protein RHSIM_Rhsim02G0098000 [Rhododendron simsii]|uniref:Uncharacterized protein n=1 Tax=Rhododendron simsii TaxID=118357 RepID=A0A834HAG5_RHOSS|nr:hypothetical protein RHSIM_Rhsim02G0098000 [Rhododendron simsii]
MTCADTHSAGSYTVERRDQDATRFHLLPQKFWTEVERYGLSNGGSSSNPNRARAAAELLKQWLICMGFWRWDLLDPDRETGNSNEVGERERRVGPWERGPLSKARRRSLKLESQAMAKAVGPQRLAE